MYAGVCVCTLRVCFCVSVCMYMRAQEWKCLCMCVCVCARKCVRVLYTLNFLFHEDAQRYVGDRRIYMIICDRIWENVHSSHIRFCAFKGS